MKGKASKPVISIDKKAISKSIGDNLKKQGQELIDLFKKDNDSLEDKDPGFIFEWEEDDPN